MNVLLNLAKQCEEVARRDRALDFVIHGALKGWPIEQTGNEFYARIDGKRYMVGWLGNEVKSTYYEVRSDSIAPAYTASVDAALLMIPTGWRVAEVGETVIDCSDPWAVRLFERCKHDRDSQKTRGDAATFALALCAAALKARAAIAMEAATAGETEGLDPKDDSAGPKDIAQ